MSRPMRVLRIPFSTNVERVALALAFKGMPVYTNQQDHAPGDIYGLRSSDHHFQPLMRSGRGVQGGGA